MKRTLTTLVLSGLAGMAQADITVQTVLYEIDGQPYEGLLVFDEAVTTPRPGVLMVPNWMGVTEAAAEKAAKVAGSEYVVFVADMYGRDIRPQNADEAAAAATTVRNDRPMMREPMPPWTYCVPNRGRSRWILIIWRPSASVLAAERYLSLRVPVRKFAASSPSTATWIPPTLMTPRLFACRFWFFMVRTIPSCRSSRLPISVQKCVQPMLTGS